MHELDYYEAGAHHEDWPVLHDVNRQRAVKALKRKGH